MTKTVEVVAREPLTYQGRSLVPGECFECVPVDALLLLQHRKITAPAKSVWRAPAKYLRRDMRAER